MQVDHSNNIIEVSRVSFSYNGDNVLDDVSLDIHLGDYLGIVGPNGGGKTTLLKIILGLLKPKHGSVKLFGTALEDFTKWEYIGYVPQKATHFESHFPATVEEVVAMGKGRRSKEVVEEALRDVEMESLADRMISDLSGGQQQRVFIARALAGKPKVLLLDEPTVGVDVSVQKEFYALLKKLNQQKELTLVLVTHDIETIARETTEIACVNKKLLYEREPKEMLKHGLLQKMYGDHMAFIGHTHEQ